MFPPKIEYQCRLDHCPASNSNPLEFNVTVSGFSKKVFFDVTVQSKVSPAPVNRYRLFQLYTQFTCLPEDKRNKELLVNSEEEQQIFCKIYQHIKNWRRLGHNLGLKETDLDEIDHNNENRGHNQIKCDVLVLWSRMTSKKTPNDIAISLHNTEEDDALEALVKFLES